MTANDLVMPEDDLGAVGELVREVSACLSVPVLGQVVEVGRVCSGVWGLAGVALGNPPPHAMGVLPPE